MFFQAFEILLGVAADDFTDWAARHGSAFREGDASVFKALRECFILNWKRAEGIEAEFGGVQIGLGKKRWLNLEGTSEHLGLLCMHGCGEDEKDHQEATACAE